MDKNCGIRHFMLLYDIIYVLVNLQFYVAVWDSFLLNVTIRLPLNDNTKKVSK